jgi:hypothetical protein
LAQDAAATRTVSRDQGRPSRAVSVSRARIGVAATPPRPMRALTTSPSTTSMAYPTATLEMSSKRRLAILWKALISASGNGMRTDLISSSALRTDDR